MITRSYQYASGSGFVYDSSKIEFQGGAVKLKRASNPGQLFTLDLSASQFDPSVVEYAGGALRQKDNRQPGFKSFFAWTSQLDGDYGDGDLDVIATGAAAISGGFLDVSGTDNYVRIPAEYIPINLGTIAFKYKPGYSGAPATTQYILDCNAGGGIASLFHFVHGNSGQLGLQVFAIEGAIINNESLGNWSPTSGEVYEFVIQFDSENGATKIFIDGEQFGSTHNGTGDRAETVNAFIGSSLSHGATSDFSINNLSFYNQIVAPENCFGLASTVFAETGALLETFTYEGLGDVQAWTSFAITASSDAKFILNGKYWNGSAWVNSSMTYNTASTAAQIAANIGTFPVSNSIEMAVGFQANNDAAMQVSAMVLTYVGQAGFNQTDPSIATDTALGVDGISSFVASKSATGSDNVKWLVCIDSVNYYWTGSAWAASNGTYAQANTDTEVDANLASLPLTGGASVTFAAILHSASGSTTPSLTALEVIYDYHGTRPDGPNSCVVYGYIVDDTNEPVSGAVVTVTNPKTFFNQGLAIAQGSRTATTDDEGYFEITLTETESVSKKFKFEVSYPVGGKFVFGLAIVPDTDVMNLTDMTFTGGGL